MPIEDQNIEFKQEFTPNIKKEIIAFANSEGGVLYIGVDNNGEHTGLQNIDDIMLRTSNCVRDGILPDVTMFVAYEIDKDIIKVTVNQGSNKPYYLSDKGLKSSGVYIRQGSSSAPASQFAIRQMIKNTDGDKYELVRSLVQDLTFDETTAEFTRHTLPFGDNQMKTLGLKTADGIFTNTALLLSEQCRHTIKVACFEGFDKGIFKDRREFEGSLLRQLRDVFGYVGLFNKLHAHFEGIDRIENKDYPDNAIREALLNAIVHREYSFSGSTLINIYDDRIEFVSLGGLVPGLTRNDIMLGVSQSRNERLANVFYRLKHIEAYGMGLKQIVNSYADYDIKPTITVTDGAFLISLPNKHYNKAEVVSSNENPQQRQILDHIVKNAFITRKDVQELLLVKQTRAFVVLSEMMDSGLIKAVGNGKSKRYILQKKP